MKYYKLDYYIEKIKKGEKFSIARYGDGELYCMWGKKGQNSNGCKYYPLLRQDLVNSMKMGKDFIFGLQRVLPQDEKRIIAEYPDIDWHDSEFLSEAVANGELYPLIEILRTHRVVVIGNESISEKTKEIFGWATYIFVPPSNAYDERERVIKSIKEDNAEAFLVDTIYLFSCGMAANAFIAELHGFIDGWLLDVGHIWDAFTGNMSRCDLEGKTMEDINKNLQP